MTNTDDDIGSDPPEPVTVLPAGPNDGPDNPHRLAAGYLGGRGAAGWPAALVYWRSDFHRYQAGSYQALPEDDQRGELTEWVRSEYVRVHAAERAAWLAAGDTARGKAPQVRRVTTGLIRDVLQALRGMCLLPAAVEAPAWINGATGPDPTRLLPLRNGILDLSADLAGGLLPATPDFFSTTAAPLNYDHAAALPAEWLRFLRELWPDDEESRAALQEWFGYLLTPDTRHQKILFILGPRRAGKGTITRVLRELVGPANVAGPTLGSLATNFGLSALLGRSVAIVSDARLSSRSDAAVITERLLSISGEDVLTVDRKFRDPLSVKLNARFVVVSNELPKLADTSGALAGRFFPLLLSRSWFDREDTALFDRLRAELPGILLWAVEGWRRLRERGRFVQPCSAAGLVEDMEDLASPIKVFLRERCAVGPGQRVEVSELYREWCRWCSTTGQRDAGTHATFGRDIRAAVPTAVKARLRTPEGRLHVYTGIRLRDDSDPDHDASVAGGQGGHSGHSAPPLDAGNEPGLSESHGTAL